MSKRKHHMFEVNDATDYGVDEAIFIYHLKFWIDKNRANKKHLIRKDGVLRCWTYNTLEAYSELFPYWTIKQVRRIIDSLVKQGVIIVDRFNKIPYDQTRWYAFKGGQESPVELPKQDVLNCSISC